MAMERGSPRSAALAINANQVMVFEWTSLWLPILDRGVVLRVTPLARIVE